MWLTHIPGIEHCPDTSVIYDHKVMRNPFALTSINQNKKQLKKNSKKSVILGDGKMANTWEGASIFRSSELYV